MSTDKDTLREVLRWPSDTLNDAPDPDLFNDALDGCDTPTELQALLDRISLTYHELNTCNACSNAIGDNENPIHDGHAAWCPYVTAWLRVHLNERELKWRTLVRRHRAGGEP
jgi:hypothetical protein